jgi:hypothetical protein
MLRLLTATALLTFTVAFGTRAQDTGSMHPEFKNKVYAVTAENTLSDLDNTDFIYEMRTGMTAKLFFRAAGLKSAVIKPGNTRFAVRIEPGVDPETVVELFKLATDKNSRFIQVGSISMGSSKPAELPKQKLSFSKMADGVYMITPREPLSPGEYAFIINRPATVPLGGSASAMGQAFSVGE